MTDEELFLSEKAEYFGNRLIWRHKDVGIKVPGGAMILTPEGEEVLAQLKDITDVEAKPAKKARKAEVTANVDDLLGGDIA
jgi:hypothetical protein